MADAGEDLYDILGVKRDATADEIRKAYKKLARKYHPDANSDDPSAGEKFRRVGDAWRVLGNPEKRANYDKYGTADAPQFQGGSRETGGPQSYSWSSAGGDAPFDLEELFGGFRGASGGQREWPIRGQDIRAEIEIPFLLAADGGKYDLQLQRPGKSKPETLNVSVPAGVDTGNVIRLAGLGTPGSGGASPGDLLVSIRVAAHPWFKREGSNVLLDVPISITEAALGARVEIPTLRDGTVVLTIPPGTSSGARLRLKEKGIVDRRTGKAGDQLVVVKIVAPKDLDDRSRELLQELQSSLAADVRSGLF